jgi:hypothetical protein
MASPQISISDFSNEECEEYLRTLETLWKPGEGRISEWLGRIEDHVIENISDQDQDSLEELFRKKEDSMHELLARFDELGMIDRDTSTAQNPESHQSLMVRMVSLERSLHQAKICLMNGAFALSSNEDNDQRAWALIEGYKRFSDNPKPDVNTVKDYLTILCARKGYRRHDGKCYRRKVLNGRQTVAFEYVEDIETMAINACNKRNKNEFWKLMAKKGNREDIITYLKEYHDPDFPDLIKNRHIYVFNNGTWITKVKNDDDMWCDMFIPHDQSLPSFVSKRDAASKYFNTDFVEIGDQDWFDYVTENAPNFKKIMAYQEWSDPVQRWFIMMLARIMYSRGDLDDWQVDPYCLGAGGAGKSTCLQHVVENFFEACDIGSIPNNCERKFALMNVIGKLAFTAPEVKKDFCMEQGDFQCVISNDTVTINVKHKPPQIVHDFDVPGIYAGNEVPDYGDNSGSISRRLLIFRFNKGVTPETADCNLPTKLRREVPIIMAAGVKAYHEQVNKMKTENGNIWFHAPAFFREQQRAVTASTHPLQAYLDECRESGRLVFCKNADIKDSTHPYYILQRDFRDEFFDWCKRSGKRLPNWNLDFYNTVFQRENIKLSKRVRRRWPPIGPGELKHSLYFFGIAYDDYLERNDDDPENQAR